MLCFAFDGLLLRKLLSSRMLKKIFIVFLSIVPGFAYAQAIDEKTRNNLSGSWSTKCGVADVNYIVIEPADVGKLKFSSKNRDILLSSANLIGFEELPSNGNKSNYAEGKLLATYQLDWDRHDLKTNTKDNRRWKIEYLKNVNGIEQFVYVDITINDKKIVQDNKTINGGTTAITNSKCSTEQMVKMSAAIPQKEVEFKEALQRIRKTPVTLKMFNESYEALCKDESSPKYESLDRLKSACDVYIEGENSKEADRAAAQLIFGIGLSNYVDNQFPGQPCRDAFDALQKSAGYIEKNLIAFNDAHDRIGYCLLVLERYDQALKWLDRSNKLKESAFTIHLMGVAHQNMNNFTQAKKSYQSALVLDPSYEAPKKRLEQLDQAIAQNDREQAAYKKRVEEINTPACRSWRAAITKNRASCDKLMMNSLDSFYYCMDLGMIRSGYAKRADAQTQQLYQQCGIGSWTESQLAP